VKVKEIVSDEAREDQWGVQWATLKQTLTTYMHSSTIYSQVHNMKFGCLSYTDNGATRRRGTCYS